MKKKTLLLIPVCILLGSLVWSLAAADREDPLASLSYLTGAFTKQVEAEVEERLDESDEALLAQLQQTGEIPVNIAPTWVEKRMKQEDILLGSTGTGVLLLSGSVTVRYASGAVVDVTTGTVLASGAALEKQHRYLVAEETSASFIVASPTAVIDYQGSYTFQDSSLPDYNAMARALCQLNMFRGTTIGYGEGFELEEPTTRIQALIMFIRVLGEEEEALAWTGNIPFKDVLDWAKPYVGYAYEKGYTNGTGPTTFSPDMAATANHYTEFVLRAMGYSSTANIDLSDTLIRAYETGVLTEGEVGKLGSLDTFLRAELVYISYYALHAELPNGDTLAERLQDKGVFTASAWKEARKSITTGRL